MRKNLQGRVAVITGASSGIGQAVAVRFAAEGMPVVLGARRTDRLVEVADGIRRMGGEVHPVETDVTRPADVRRLVDEAVARFGKIDVLVSNAGVGYFGPVESTPLDEVHRLFDVNVQGAIHGIQAVLPVMRRRRSGHIVTVASIVGKRAAPGNGVYSATKAAVIALSESLRLEAAADGIAVSVICPVSTTTEFFAVAGARSPLRWGPIPPIYSADAVAARILECVRRPRAEVMIHRPARVLIALNALTPGLVDRILGSYWRKIRPGTSPADSADTPDPEAARRTHGS